MSKIEIINRALLKLGEPPISSLNDAAFGRSYEIIYDDVKKLLLSSYPWRFAVGHQQLAQRTEKFGERYMYQLPKDCLLILNVFGTDRFDVENIRPHATQGYEVANDCIVTTVKKGVAVEYVKDVDDLTLFPPLFKEAIAAKVASELCMRIKHSLQLKQVLDNEFFSLIRQAELNSEIAKDVEQVPDNSWVLVRNCF